MKLIVNIFKRKPKLPKVGQIACFFEENGGNVFRNYGKVGHYYEIEGGGKGVHLVNGEGRHRHSIPLDDITRIDILKGWDEIYDHSRQN